MRVLGIETSCDETGVAIYDDVQGLMAEKLHSQIALHTDFGGVIPELASRDHVQKLLPLIDQVLKESNTEPYQLDAIAFTEGPGLVGALMVGATTAQMLGFAWKLPAVGIHHMEGHLLAPLLEDNGPDFPFVGLLVSGGHSQLVYAKSLGEYELLGDTLDDAAGEAFDKTAKLLGLPYPGGPSVAKRALDGDASRFDFPRPMVNRPGLDFSFSGLKTFTLTTAESCTPVNEQDINDICAGFEMAVADTLAIKCKRALQQTGSKRLVIAGGVSANVRLREKLTTMVKKEKAELFLAKPALCTDNGAMIAFAASLRLKEGLTQKDNSQKIAVRPRWPLSDLSKEHSAC